MTHQGLTRFSRSMATKYAGTCEFCATATKPGIDFAALNSGSWIAVCATCAASITEQVKGSVRRLQALMTEPGIDAEIYSNVQTLLPVSADLATALQPDADEALAYDVLIKLSTALLYFKTASAKPVPLLDGLNAVANNSKASPKDRAVAADMAAAATRYGRLTERQQSYAKALIARYDGSGKAAAPTAADEPNIEEGGFYVVGKDLFKVVKAKAGHLYAMILLTPSEGRKFVWEFSRGGIQLVRAQGKQITAEQAATMGKLAHHCVFCNRSLKDDGDNKSIDVGYGPVCANKHGLPWG